MIASGWVNAQSDFPTRCGAPGVIKCQGFNSMGTPGNADLVMYNVNSSQANILPRSDGQYRATVDPVIKLSGAGSLQFKLDAGYSSANIAGQYLPQTNDGLGPGFGENSDMYIQYAVRFSPEMFSNLAQWDSYWKVSIFHQNSASCAAKELTTNTYYGGPSTMYKDCGAEAMYTGLDGQTWTSNTPLLVQQGDYACEYPNWSVNCWNYPTNKWITLYYKVHIGTYGQANSTIEAWYSVDGLPYKKWINVTKGFKIYCNGASPCPGEVFNNVTFTPYMTALSVPAPVDAYVWYDEFIVSNQPIAAPVFTTAIANNYYEKNFKISPNPSQGRFTVSFDLPTEASVQVVDIFGREVFSNETSGSVVDLDLSKQPSGIYFLQITNENSLMNEKLVIHSKE